MSSVSPIRAEVGLPVTDSRSTDAAGDFQARRLEQLFASCFTADYRTRLVGGASEPYYEPAASAHACHHLYYRSDYFASALHETAHWCIAGERRRQLPDFGYWYAADGRNAQQQFAFEAVEAKPQALEWLFSQACRYRFIISVDNLGAPDIGTPDDGHFKQQVLAQARGWRQRGLPHRAQVFFAALALEFGTGLQLQDLALEAGSLD